MSEYDTDTVQWSEHQAELLRRRATGQLINETELDWSNIAEEIESLGKLERSTLASRIRTIIEHLAKLQASPAVAPRAGWEYTIQLARTDIEVLLRDSPSLKHNLDAVVRDERGRALRLAAAGLKEYAETPRVALEDIDYTTEQVLGPWLP